MMDLAGRLLGSGASGLGDITLTGSSTVRFEQTPSDPDPQWPEC